MALNSQSENTLLVSYLFPPAGGVGVQRAISYAKYLGAAGCPVTVLTTRNPVTAWYDPALLAAIPQDVPVERAITPEPPYPIRHWVARHIIPRAPSTAALDRNNANGNGHAAASAPAGLTATVKRKLHELLSPDPQRFWVPFALRKAVRLVKERNIKNVLVTTPPFSTLNVGIRLKQLFPHLTLISEFRDEWLNYYLSLDPNRSATRYAIASALEADAVAHSDAVVTVTAAWRDSIRNRYPDEQDSKFLHIPNGFDPTLFANFHADGGGTGAGEPRKLVIGYLGTVYWKTSTPPNPSSMRSRGCLLRTANTSSCVSSGGSSTTPSPTSRAPQCPSTPAAFCRNRKRCANWNPYPASW